MQTPAQKIQQIYIGLLGRAADRAGLTYWATELCTNKMSVDQIRDNFVNHQVEYASDFGQLNRQQVVKELYLRLFDREVEPAGLEYWANGAGKAVGVDHLVVALGNSAGVEDRQALDNKVKAAEYYTENIVAYDKQTARHAVSTVNEKSATVVAAMAYTDDKSRAQGELDTTIDESLPTRVYDQIESVLDSQSFDASTGNNRYIFQAQQDIQVANINGFNKGDALDIDEEMFGRDTHLIFTDGVNLQFVFGVSQANPAWFVNLNGLDQALIDDVSAAQSNVAAIGVLDAALGDWII